MIEVNETPRAELILKTGGGREAIRAGLVNLKIESFTTIKQSDTFDQKINKIDEV